LLNIKKFRGEKNISIAELARRSGVTRSYICELENGTYANPGLKTICKLCKALRCTPNNLIPEKLYRGDVDGESIYGNTDS
jgi:putative transcriptional regulator